MKKIMILLFLGLMVFTSCKKDDTTTNSNTTPTSMEELKISKNFDWKTTQLYEFKLTGNQNKTLRIISEEGIVYHKAFLKTGILYDIKLTLPAYEQKVYLLYNGNNIECILDKSVITYNFK